MLSLHPLTSFRFWPIRAQVCAALAACLAFSALAWGFHRHQAAQVQALQKQVQALRADAAAAARSGDALGAQPAQPGNKRIDPTTWPPRADADEVTKWAGELAKEHGLVLRSLSLSHQPISAQNWGSVRWEMSVQGPYASLKAWQAGLQSRFDALALQSLRLQGASSSPSPSSFATNLGGVGASGDGALDARFTWVLHVRD